MSGRVGETSLGDYAALYVSERERDNTADHYHQSSCCHSNRPWNFMLTLDWQVCLNKRNVCLPQGDWPVSLLNYMDDANKLQTQTQGAALQTRWCSRAAMITTGTLSWTNPITAGCGCLNCRCRRDMWEIARMAVSIWLLIVWASNPPKRTSGLTGTGWWDTSLDDVTHLKTVEIREQHEQSMSSLCKVKLLLQQILKEKEIANSPC